MKWQSKLLTKYFKIFAKALSTVRGYLPTILVCIFYSTSSLFAQEVDFGEFSDSYPITITQLGDGDLNFGILVKGETAEINLTSPDVQVVSIEGIKYLDVIVQVIADPYLALNGANCSASSDECITFTLEAAYANQGTNNTNEAVLMQVTSNYSVAQFPLIKRGNLPPGPPPTPNFEGYNPSAFNTTAYLYIFGSITMHPDQLSGEYNSNIEITISYD